MALCEYVYMTVDAYRGQKRASELLEWELQMVMSHLKWVLGMKLVSSGRAVCAQTHIVKSVYKIYIEPDRFKENKGVDGRTVDR